MVTCIKILVDDSICISEAGYKAQMMNVAFNTKTAEKTLQFGAKKCKTMLVGRNVETIHQNRLSVDQSEVKLEDDSSGKTHTVESYMGKIEISPCDEKKYLGFIIFNSDSNTANIRSIRNKSYGTIKTILSKLNSLNLRKYYFESGMIFKCYAQKQYFVRERNLS